MNIFCENNRGFGWNESKDTFAKGYLYDAENKLYENQSLADYFKKIETPEEFERLLKTSNGFFIVIKKHQNGWLAGVDPIRSMPLFFTYQENQIFISDDAFLLENKFGNQTINPLQKSAFLRSGHTLGNATLSDTVKQLEAGQYLYFDGKEPHIRTYYNHLRGNYFFKSKEQQFEELKKVSENVFNRLINYAGGRQLVIPLSGGYDSRYIAAMMKELKYENVLCYTYGIPSSYEVKIARRVAQQLNYKWHFVEYPKDWTPYYQCHDYQVYASQLCSLPHEQDFLAIKDLKEKKLIEEDAIIVPGFCGDLLGGSVIPEFYKMKKDVSNNFLVNYLYETSFCYENKVSKNDKSEIQQIILSDIFKDGVITNMDEFINMNEAYLTKNYVSKYIVNEIRIFDFFGYQWSMPLWDNELIDWWYRIPNEDRVGENKRYDQFLMEYLFKRHNIDIPKKKNKRPNYILKNILGNYIMSLCRVAYINSPFYHDINLMLPMLRLFQADLKKAKQDCLITTKGNKILAAWTMLFIENTLKQERK